MKGGCLTEQVVILLLCGNVISARKKECGLRYAVNRHEPAISHGWNTNRSEYPWHVAIYKQNQTIQPQYICGGSIIDENLIITAAHCVYNEDAFEVENSTFFVVAGKHQYSWEHKDLVEQRFKVSSTIMPQTYVGFTNRYADDIGLLLLNDSIRFSSYIMPICIDWKSEIELNTISTPGTIVGWGLNERGTLSTNLTAAKLNYYNFTTCRHQLADEGFATYVTSDKFCAGLENGTAVNKGDSGGGLVFPWNNGSSTERYYLFGIVSTKDIKGGNIAAFTNVKSHLKWINSSMTEIKNTGNCMKLDSLSVELTDCAPQDDCNIPTKPGTRAKVRCKRTFYSQPPFNLYSETMCHKNRSWSPLNDSCLDCGKRYKYLDLESLTDEKEKERTEFPWHVAVYIKMKGIIKYICGGSIIHPNIVLTAAHCVQDGNASNYYVVAGKLKSSWNHRTPVEQRFQIVQTYIKETYHGRFDNFANDIAILELNGTLSMSNYMMPACIDWSKMLELYKNPLISGLSVGWGADPLTGIPNEELTVARFIHIDWNKCRKGYSALPEDKLCATTDDGFFNLGSSGFSGGALTFPMFNFDTGEHINFIYGLTSTKYKSFFLFTNVLYHKEWILNKLRSIIRMNQSKKKKFNS